MTDAISRSAVLPTLLNHNEGYLVYCDWHDSVNECRAAIDSIPALDVVPVDVVADMLAYMFNDECPCNYNDIDEWLPYVCENTETCPDVVGKHSCWKQFIKHWMNRKGEDA